MVQHLPYAILDVFTTQAFSGNPLAVVQLSADIPASLKQQIAKEFNLSETVFWHVYDTTDDTTRIDIFTPEEELPFAGHPTIGSACAVLRHLNVDQATLRIKAGPVRVMRDKAGYCHADIPHNHRRHSNPRHVICSIVPGMAFVLVPVSSLAALAACTTMAPCTLDDLDADMRHGFIGTYYYCAITEEGGVHEEEQKAAGDRSASFRCRMFASLNGVQIEDAATGSAACALAAHLSDTHLDPSLTLRITQGVEMGRPSAITVSTKRTSGDLSSITLGGQAVSIMQGTLSL